MDIGKPAQEPGAPGEWCVRVAVSVIQNVPRDILAAWMACEFFQRDNPMFWPDNRAMLVPIGVGSVTSVQRLLLRLEDLGILQRFNRGGNRRELALLRRTSEPLLPSEWSRMEAQAADHQQERAAGRRRTAPKV